MPELMRAFTEALPLLWAFPQIEASKKPAADRSGFINQCFRTTFARKSITSW